MTDLNTDKYDEDSDTPEEETISPDESSITRALRETLTLLVMAILLAVFIYHFVIQTFWIPTGSMERTIMPGDRVLVAKFYYRFYKPGRPDVIVFKAPERVSNLEPDLIKRVIGTSGELLREKEGKVYVNNRPLREPYTLPDRPDAQFGPYRVPKDHVFVMGDNRANSRDSRYLATTGGIEPIDEKNIIGRAFFVYWPPNRIGILR